MPLQITVRVTVTPYGKNEATHVVHEVVFAERAIIKDEVLEMVRFRYRNAWQEHSCDFEVESVRTIPKEWR